MPDVFSTLKSLAAARRLDPLAPVTVIVPSHAAGLQLRRRLAELAPFAGVRFEIQYFPTATASRANKRSPSSNARASRIINNVAA